MNGLSAVLTPEALRLLSTGMFELYSQYSISFGSGSPGVVLDPETYNSYLANSVAYVARRQGMAIEQAMARLSDIGGQMGRIVEEEHPRAVIWTLFTGLEYGPPEMNGLKLYSSPALMLLGMMDHFRRERVPAKLLDGGEGCPGYYNRSLDELRCKILECWHLPILP